MIDLIPYFSKKLGESLIYNDDDHKHLMEIISVSRTSVYLEVCSMPHKKGDYEWRYRGVVKIDLKDIRSLKNVKETAVTILNSQ